MSDDCKHKEWITICVICGEILDDSTISDRSYSGNPATTTVYVDVRDLGDDGWEYQWFGNNDERQKEA